ncbi:MAG TPA: NAD(P)H-quinone oxidoreductase [Pyrinomonadaceae bacterium]|jgi:putative PIG3 family NAD(P)H quinone oxidoreductase|nr:NAD(P)H-quinone oxidoreductase [Pyrinomonadaceae bacterium]
MSETMRAVVITAAGDSEVLAVRQVPRPRAVGDRVRVCVRAAGLNRADLLQRRGLYPAPAGAPRDIPGLEFAGEVEQIGDEVRSWKVGARVFGITAGGAQAEYVVIPESALAEIPPDFDWAAAAAVPEAFITAHDALFTQADLQMGEQVLIHAIGSGVGLAAAQLARAAGAIVYGTARTPEKLEKVKEFHPDETIAVGERPDAFADAVREWSGGAGANVILDLVGASYLAANLASLAPRGRLIFVGTMGGNKATLDLSQVMGKRLRLLGTVLRARSTEEKARATRLFAAHVVPLLARGAVRPVIDSTYEMDQVREAHRRLESNQSFGKVILRIS